MTTDYYGRELIKIICCECHKEDFVPFTPKDESKVWCKECYGKIRAEKQGYKNYS